MTNPLLVYLSPRKMYLPSVLWFKTQHLWFKTALKIVTLKKIWFDFCCESSKISYFYLCVCVYLCVMTYVSRRPEEGIRSLETGVTESYRQYGVGAWI